MQISQLTAHDLAFDKAQVDRFAAADPQLILAFWGKEPLAEPDFLGPLRSAHPDALIVGCSSSGDIHTHGVQDGAWVLTGIRFEREGSRFEVAQTLLRSLGDSRPAGLRLAAMLPPEGLRGVLVFAPGVGVNGSALVQGLAAGLAPQVWISGGLAGDNGRFVQTCVLGPGGQAPDRIVAVGLYGRHLRAATASRGGWKPFGPRRRATRCADSLLYELDGQPALALYKKYLGSYADGLPANGLLFPLEIMDSVPQSVGLLRTILGVDEATQSIQLAGSVEQDCGLRLMHASPDALVEGAEQAAEDSLALYGGGPALALCVSCVGRKLVMGQRIDDEVLAVADLLGDAVVLAGFYANGEIGPTGRPGQHGLHNQTMSISMLGEDAA